jgi:UTP:GlnB (protein PII) uridylyltransferase
MRHLVKGHVWNSIEGRMVIFERYFPSFEEAKEFAEHEPYHTFKIYDHNNQLVHSGSNVEQNTYA